MTMAPERTAGASLVTLHTRALALIGRAAPELSVPGTRPANRVTMTGSAPRPGERRKGVPVLRLPNLLAVTSSIALAILVAGCAAAGPMTTSAETSTVPAPATWSASPVPVVTEGSPDIALAVVADDAEAVGLAIWELLEDGWDLGLDDHPWTIALEELDAAFEEAAPATPPGEPFAVTTTPMAVAALLVSLDREAAFFTTGGDPELADTYAVAATHVRAQLSAEQAAEVQRLETEPLATWEDGSGA